MSYQEIVPDFALIRRLAEEDADSVLGLAQRLIQTPSRAGIDSYEPVVEILNEWFTKHQVRAEPLHQGSELVGLVAEIHGTRPGPRYVLNACIDTAPFGDLKAWTDEPTSGRVVDGWLHGRGSADSKTAAAIFAHIAARMQGMPDAFAGTCAVLFDADEHTGNFGGAKAYFSRSEPVSKVSGVMIGYPGHEHLVIGGRGFFRVRISVFGVAGHSGGRHRGISAIRKAAEIVHSLSEQRFPAVHDPAFPNEPSLMVTGIRGGEAFTITPDLCTLDLDVRLTPRFDGECADRLVREVLVDIDSRWQRTKASEYEVEESWPAYRLADENPLVVAISEGARRVGLLVEPKIASPANIGNYLALQGIPATAGFGLPCRGIHAINECARIDMIPQIQAVYHCAMLMLLS